MNDTPVNDLPVNDTPVNDLPVNDLMVANSTLGHTPVNDLPVNDLAAANTVVVCAAENPTAPNRIDCTSAITLKQAFDQHAIRPGVTLKDLRAAAGPSPNVFDDISIGDLHYWGNVTIKGLVDSLPPNTMTLGDYFLLVLRSPTASQGLAWERLNLSSGLSQYSTNGSTVDYRAHFTVQPNGGPSGVPSPMTVKVTLGDGFLYESGTSRLVQDPATCSPTSPSIPDPNVTPLPNGELELKWGITATVGSSYSICLTTRPGIELGPQASSIDATPVGGTTGSATGGTVDVGDTNEPNNNADATAPELFDNSFYLSYLTSSDDVDYYRFKAPAAGTIMTFHLSHLPADYDLVVYGPPETPLRPPIAGTMPLDEPPVTDSGADLTHQTDALPSQTLDDLQLQPNMPLAGVSASRGTDPEDIVAVSPGGSGYYTIQVTGYNGATSPDPYMLRVATRAPRPVSPVPARTITGTAGPALPTTLPTGLNTVFLVNRKQLEGTYGSTGATNVMTALANDSARFTTLGFPNVTLSVDNATNDTGGAVAAAYAQWNAHPGDPAAANGVVQAINAMVDSKIRSQPNGSGLKYLVIVGGDQVIPFARLDDFTITSANESSYADTFSQGSDLFSALNLSQMLSDDPYATTAPVPYLTRQLYVPNLSVGRLVETPDDIVRTLNNFVSPSVNGVLNPTTSLTTGYDFLYDSSTTINGYMRSRFSAATASSLLDNPATPGDTWSLTQLIGAFVPLTAATPSITSLNGHASHYQFQAPKDDAGVRGGILTTAHPRRCDDVVQQPSRLQHGLPRRALGGRLDRDRRGREHARLGADVRAEGRRLVPRQHGLRLRRHARDRVLGGAEPAVRAEHRGRREGRQRARRREAGVLRRARRLRRLRREGDGRVHALRPADVGRRQRDGRHRDERAARGRPGADDGRRDDRRGPGRAEHASDHRRRDHRSDHRARRRDVQRRPAAQLGSVRRAAGERADVLDGSDRRRPGHAPSPDRAQEARRPDGHERARRA